MFFSTNNSLMLVMFQVPWIFEILIFSIHCSKKMHIYLILDNNPITFTNQKFHIISKLLFLFQKNCTNLWQKIKKVVLNYKMLDKNSFYLHNGIQILHSRATNTTILNLWYFCFNMTKRRTVMLFTWYIISQTELNYLF